MKFVIVALLGGVWLPHAASQSPANASSLTAPQTQAIQQKLQALETDTKAQTEKLSGKVASIAKEIDRNLLSAHPDEALDRKLSDEFTAAVSDIGKKASDAKLATIRDIVKLLNPEQKAALLAELDKPGSNPDLAELIGKVFGSK
jgi:hypothetical protein